MCVQQAGFLEEVVVPHGLVPVEGHVLPRDHRALLGRRRLGYGRHLCEMCAQTDIFGHQ